MSRFDGGPALVTLSACPPFVMLSLSTHLPGRCLSTGAARLHREMLPAGQHDGQQEWQEQTL